MDNRSRFTNSGPDQEVFEFSRCLPIGSFRFAFENHTHMRMRACAQHCWFLSHFKWSMVGEKSALTPNPRGPVLVALPNGCCVSFYSSENVALLLCVLELLVPMAGGSKCLAGMDPACVGAGKWGSVTFSPILSKFPCRDAVVHTTRQFLAAGAVLKVRGGFSFLLRPRVKIFIPLCFSFWSLVPVQLFSFLLALWAWHRQGLHHQTPFSSPPAPAQALCIWGVELRKNIGWASEPVGEQ